MSSKNVRGQEVSAEQGTNEHAASGVVDEHEIDVRPSVEQKIQARVDTNHPDTGRTGLTLAAEERLEAREWEIERTRTRWDRGQESTREVRTREVVSEASATRRHEFDERAASVDPALEPGADPRERLERDQLAAVNQQAARLEGKLENGSTRAAIARQLATRLLDGQALMSATVAVYEAEQTRAGSVIPIASVADVPRGEVSVEGRVTKLWTPNSSKIAAVGLLEDDSGRIKVTSWKKSQQPRLREGDVVRVRSAAKSWYNGRCSIALTGWSTVEFPEQGEWWAE